MRRKSNSKDCRLILHINNNSIQFDSPKEAVAYLKEHHNIIVSENAIKIRCSNNKTVDNIKYTWVNPASHRGRANRKKGHNFELGVIRRLNEIGYNCVSSRSESKRTDDKGIDIIDLDDKLPFNIQCKYSSNTPNYFLLKEKCPDKTKPFAIAWKKATNDGTNSPGTIIMMDIEEFYKCIKLTENSYSSKD